MWTDRNQLAQLGSQLGEPLDLRKRVMRNRIVQAPLSVCYAEPDGQVGHKTISHYERRATGGVGMVITENFAISEEGRQLPRHGLIAGREYLQGLTQLAERITAQGALAVIQVVHAGRYAGPWERYEEARRFAPSAVPFELTANRVVTPAEITREEIHTVTDQFVRAALLAREAGFDGLEIHGAQGFLLASFQSPRMNTREDNYGGDYDGRVRMTVEVVEAVVDAVGDDMLIGYHLMSDEMMPGGWTVEDAAVLAGLLTDRGVDFIAPIPTTFESLRLQRTLTGTDPTKFSEHAFRTIAETTKVPLFANGGLGDPRVAERVLADGLAAAVMLGRPVLTDPDWARKALGGSHEPIVVCSCGPPTCLATQMTGTICHAWSPDDQAQGYVGTPNAQ
jgi:2,4-dienoyl-CoA reductase (NADPH2)